MANISKLSQNAHHKFGIMLEKKMTKLMNRTSELTENRLVILHDPGVVIIIGGSTETCKTFSCDPICLTADDSGECHLYNYNKD